MKNVLKNHYSLNCDYYTKQFISINDLIDDVLLTGQDPSYEITKSGKSTGELLSDLI